MIESHANGSLDILFNKQWPVHMSKFLENDPKKKTIVQSSYLMMQSHSIHSVQLLKDLFIGGK